MLNRRTAHVFLGALAAVLLVAPGCNRTGDTKEVKELSDKAAQLDQLDQKAKTAHAQEAREIAEAAVSNVTPDPKTLQLSDQQRAFLEARIKQEKNSSYQGLLQDILDKDKEIKGLNGQIAQLRTSLPRPEIAKEDDNHYSMAMNFLRRKGVNEDKARDLVAKVLIMDKLEPGFEVYHFYSHGVYGTWVAQGRASISPTQMQADAKTAIEGERDAANKQVAELQAKVGDLNAQAEKLTADITSLNDEKARLSKELVDLTAANQTQVAMLNSVHYLVGARKALEQEGIIVVPVFSKDRAGSNWKDQAFTKSADLRNQDSITLTAAEAGLDKIRKVEVVPGSLVKDQQYTLAINPDQTEATVTFLNKDRFRNEKVVFALAD